MNACHAEILAEDTEATELADDILVNDVISRQGWCRFVHIISLGFLLSDMIDCISSDFKNDLINWHYVYVVEPPIN